MVVCGAVLACGNYSVSVLHTWFGGVSWTRIIHWNSNGGPSVAHLPSDGASLDVVIRAARIAHCLSQETSVTLCYLERVQIP